MAQYDLVIRNASLVDGTGADVRQADVAVRGERIAAIGTVRERGRDELDAQGLALAPGVIDVHTHYDAQLTWDPTASPSPALGVTTVVIGNCGFGIAPATPDTRDLILSNLSVVEAMSLDSLRAGVRWEFETFGQYLELLRRRGVVPNVASFASHSAIRSVVMKQAGSERAATPEELARMTQIFRESMRDGAIGLGSSTFENHNGFGGVPVPSRMADDEEFLAFASVIAEFGVGVTMITCGNRTTIDFLEQLARASGRPALYAPLLHYSNQPERASSIAAQCAAARARGVPVYAQASCQPLSMDFTVEHAYPMLTVGPWSELAKADRAAMKAAFASTDFRDRMRQSLRRAEGTRIFNGAWDQVEVTLAATPGNGHLQGCTIAELAARRGVDPVDAFLDLALDEDLQTTFTAKLLNVEENRVAELLANDGNLVSLSDGGAHLTFFCDAGFGMHFLGRWVRELRAFDLPAAVRKLTSDVADIYGLIDRGRIAVGAFADMILFDPQRIGISRTIRSDDLPGGASRLTRTAPGLHTVWVNGVPVHGDGRYLNVERAPGHVLTRFSGAGPTVGMARAGRARGAGREG
ncbi:MAG TPA: amidohydrolase family protein [Burkholderiaceae bacterium]|nr:amidohydrolase family protein [Burkholderiaceae bacterium]